MWIGFSSLCVGIAVGYAIAHFTAPSHKLWVQMTGPIPRWEVEWVVGRTIEALVSHAGNPEASQNVHIASKKLRINLRGDRGWVIWPDGRIDVCPGSGWEARLSQAVAHSLHHSIFGDVDPVQKDRAWFRAANRAVERLHENTL